MVASKASGGRIVGRAATIVAYRVEMLELGSLPCRGSSIIVLESRTIVIDKDITYRFYPSEGNDLTADISICRG
jgi:hypothetical protein